MGRALSGMNVQTLGGEVENRVISSKEYVEAFAEIAEKKGYQTLSCDFPEHGERMPMKKQGMEISW